MEQKNIVILGANGQFGRALQQLYPEAKALDSSTLDITDNSQLLAYDWSTVTIIINAAGYTNVDGAETQEGRISAWQVNAVGTANVARIAIEHDLTLVHVSTDYVFDGRQEIHDESEPLSPLGVYSQSKAAGDIVVNGVPKHYLLRASWVIGDGKNFVRSILGLGQKGVSPSVVADQFGRLTFTTELVRATDYLLKNKAPFGTYNVSNDGDVVSWAEIARQIYTDAGFNELQVSDTTAEAYFAGKLSSPRPVHSALDLAKLKATGFEPHDWRDDLANYIKEELA